MLADYLHGVQCVLRSGSSPYMMGGLLLFGLAGFAFGSTRPRMHSDRFYGVIGMVFGVIFGAMLHALVEQTVLRLIC